MMPQNKNKKQLKKEIKQKMELQQCDAPVVSSKTLKNRRKRQRRAAKRNSASASGAGSGAGLAELPISRGVVSSGLGNSKMGRSYRRELATHNLGERGNQFIHRHCNPCGEMVTYSNYSKVPDGALPNSAVLELRQTLIIRAPGLSSSVIDLNTGSMWTLTLIHTSLFRTPLILIANMANAEMTAQNEDDLISAWNSADAPPEYPVWEQFANDANSYWCTATWSGLSGIPVPTGDGATTAINQFRICADGITIYNNTPDLINQGMVIGAQWNTDQSLKVFETDESSEGFAIALGRMWYAGSTDPTAITTYYRITIPDASTGGTTFMQASGTTPTVTYVATKAFSSDDVDVSVGDTLTLSITFTYASSNMTFVGTLVNTTTTTTVASYSNNVAVGASGSNVTAFIVDAVEDSMQTATQWKLPPLTTQGVIQSTPKAVYMTMKEQNGVYMVKRIFQPVFNVAEASSYRPVRMVSNNQISNPDDFINGKRDTFDMNYSTGVIIMNCLPTACAPAIKMIRDVEIVADDGSPFQLFMATNDDKIEPALEIVESIATHHPFMYPESYNSLGGLMGILSGVISKLPVIGKVMPIITPIIKGILGGEQQDSSGSQNRLISMNADEREKLLSMLMQRLGVD